MRWAILVLAVSLMGGWTSAAAAECVWVLWGESAIRPVELPIFARDQFYMIMSVHSTQQECEKQREVITPKWEKAQEMDKENAQKMAGTTQVSYSFRLICLPDTINPR